MNNFDQFKKDFKRDVLVKIVISMKHGNTTQARVSHLAKLIVATFEEEDARKVFQKINKLAETQPDILEIFIKRAAEYETRHKEDTLNQVRIYLKNGGLPVENLAKGGVN